MQRESVKNKVIVGDCKIPLSEPDRQIKETITVSA